VKWLIIKTVRRMFNSDMSRLQRFVFWRHFLPPISIKNWRRNCLVNGTRPVVVDSTATINQNKHNIKLLLSERQERHANRMLYFFSHDIDIATATENHNRRTQCRPMCSLQVCSIIKRIICLKFKNNKFNYVSPRKQRLDFYFCSLFQFFYKINDIGSYERNGV